jgi:hypothetical protein
MSENGEHSVSRLLYALAIAALVLTFAWRMYLVFHEPLNEDETNTLHKGWQLGRESGFYTSQLEVRMPLPFEVVRPFLWFGRPSLIYLAARFGQVVLTAAALLMLFLSTQAVAGRRAALWTMVVISFFNFFVARAVEVRAEPPMLLFGLASLWCYVRWRAGERGDRNVALSGALLGLAVASKVSAAFLLCGLLAVWLVDLTWNKPERSRAWRGLLLWGAGAAAAFTFVLFWASGGHVFEALKWIRINTAALRFSEILHGPTTYFSLRTLYTNPVMWLLMVIGFGALPFQLRDARRWWCVLLMIGLGWGGIISLVARKTFFEQDMILPGMLLAPAAGAWLARWLPLGGGRRSWPARAAALTVFAALLGCFTAEGIHYERYTNETLRAYQGVLATFVGAPRPDEPARQVDGEMFMDFLRGEHDRVHYHPTATMKQALAAADFVAAATTAHGVVFTEAGLPIARHEAHRLLKASVLHHMSLLEANLDPGAACLSIRRFMPGACDPRKTPGQRLYDVLLAGNPDVIVFGFGVIASIDYYPETRGWYLAGYDTWYDPTTNMFFGLRKGSSWPKQER